jgi:hypothetical protein
MTPSFATLGKVFIDDELVKLCLMTAAEGMCPGNMKLFKTTGL